MDEHKRFIVRLTGYVPLGVVCDKIDWYTDGILFTVGEGIDRRGVLYVANQVLELFYELPAGEDFPETVTEIYA